MTTLCTHVLDTMHGRPAAGMVLVLRGPQGEIARGITNADGRCPDLAPGVWRRAAMRSALPWRIISAGRASRCPIRPSSTR